MGCATHWTAVPSWSPTPTLTFRPPSRSSHAWSIGCARDESLTAVLGSRFRRLGADIRRSELRHYLGRVYATLASLALGVGIYDTQCGAKAFRASPRLEKALADPFAERWAFDVSCFRA